MSRALQTSIAAGRLRGQAADARYGSADIPVSFLRVFLSFGGTLAVAVLSAIIAVHVSQTFGFAFGLLSPLVLLLFRPDIKILVGYLIVLNVGLLDPMSLPTIDFVGGKILLSDLVLALVLALTIMRGLITRDLPLRLADPFVALLLAYGGLVLFSAANSYLFLHNSPHDILAEFKDQLSYALFFIVVLTHREEAAIQELMLFLALLTIVIGLAAALEYFAGLDLVFGKKEVMLRIGMTIYSGITRIVFQGLDLSVLMFLFSVGMLLALWRTTPWLQRNLLACVAMVALFLVVVSFRRDYMIALLVDLGFMFLIMRHKLKMAAASLVLVIYASVAVFALSSHPGVAHFLTGLSDRILSIGAEKTYAQDFSLQWRYFEAEQALKAIWAHPFTGRGLGGHYHNLQTFLNSTRYIHNAYLYLALKMGVQTLLLFLLLATVSLGRAFRLYWRLPEGPTRRVVLACPLFLLATMMAGMVQPTFGTYKNIFLIALVWGLVEAIRGELYRRLPARPGLQTAGRQAAERRGGSRT